MEALPNELLCEIVRHVDKPLAPCAAVSNRMRHAVERQTFQKLRMHLLDLTRFDMLFLGSNSYRQVYLRRLEFMPPVPDQSRRTAYDVYASPIPMMLQKWTLGVNLEVVVLPHKGGCYVCSQSYRFMPRAWPVLQMTKVSYAVTHVFRFSGRIPWELQPGRPACANLTDLTLEYFDPTWGLGDSSKHMAVRRRRRRDFAHLLRSLHGRLPCLRHLALKRVVGFGPSIPSSVLPLLGMSDVEPDYTDEDGTDALNSAVRTLAQPTVRRLWLTDWVLSPDLFINPLAQDPYDAADRWRELREFSIRADIVGADGQWYLAGERNPEPPDADGPEEPGSEGEIPTDEEASDWGEDSEGESEWVDQTRGPWRREIMPETVMPIFALLIRGMTRRMPLVLGGLLLFQDLVYPEQSFYLCLCEGTGPFPVILRPRETDNRERPGESMWYFGGRLTVAYPGPNFLRRRLREWRWDGRQRRP